MHRVTRDGPDPRVTDRCDGQTRVTHDGQTKVTHAGQTRVTRDAPKTVHVQCSSAQQCVSVVENTYFTFCFQN